MKILFINPPFQRLKGIAQIYFPLGLGYLCSSMSSDKRVDAMIYNAETPDSSERLPFHVKYQDMLKLHDRYIRSLKSEEHYIWQEVSRVVKEFNPDVVGISVLTAKYGSALRISQIIKSLNKDCKVVWGGPHASVDSERILENECVDYAIRGEGEITFKNLIDSLIEANNDFQDQLYKIDGLSYKIGSKIFHTPDRALVQNLDTLLFMQKDKVFFPERYLPSSWGDIITLRGCPFNCGYCGAHNTWTYKVRYRSPHKILEEIKMVIAKYKTRELYFWDDNFTLNRDRTLELCSLLRQSDMRISWGCTTRVDLLDDLLIKEMKQAGCNYISIGVETGSPKMLKDIHKGIILKKVNAAIDMLNKYRLSYEAFFMIGFPEETREDIEQTFNFMKKLKNPKICFSIFTPYPGTEQYEIAKKYHMIPECPDWSLFSHQSYDNHFMRYIDKKEFNEYVKKISIWIDDVNARNIDIARLFWNTYLNFGLLIKNPKLLVSKLKTFLTIGYRKGKSYLACREIKAYD